MSVGGIVGAQLNITENSSLTKTRKRAEDEVVSAPVVASAPSFSAARSTTERTQTSTAGDKAGGTGNQMDGGSGDLGLA